MSSCLSADCRPSGEIVVARKDGARSEVVVNPGARIATCAGGAVSDVVTDRRLWTHVAWTGGPPASSQLAFASSRKRDLFGVVVLTAPGPHGKPQVAIDPNDTAVVTWQTGVAGNERILMQQILPHHANVRLLPVLTISERGSGRAPAIAPIRGGVIIAWIAGSGSKSSIAVRRVGLDAICDPTSYID